VPRSLVYNIAQNARNQRLAADTLAPTPQRSGSISVGYGCDTSAIVNSLRMEAVIISIETNTNAAAAREKYAVFVTKSEST
jgi:hypothetical protein